MEFGIGVEDGDFVVGIGLPHGHVPATGVKQPGHLLIAVEISQHEDTLFVQQAVEHGICYWHVDQRHLGGIIVFHELIDRHIHVIVALYPTQLALQHTHGKRIPLQLGIVEVEVAGAVHSQHSDTLNACGGAYLQDVTRIEEIGHPEQQSRLTLADEIHLTPLLAIGAGLDGLNQLVDASIGIIGPLLAPDRTHKLVGIGRMDAEAATAMVTAPSI